mmetsp:Transcript_22394/g.25808  ORF Transcript_22394/g.25808 Transcript_22394/m.25808 type:complete len:876 (-) Transcript_22394:58-2685(-)
MQILWVVTVILVMLDQTTKADSATSSLWYTTNQGPVPPAPGSQSPATDVFSIYVGDSFAQQLRSCPGGNLQTGIVEKTFDATPATNRMASVWLPSSRVQDYKRGDNYPGADWIRHFCCDVRPHVGRDDPNDCAATPNLYGVTPPVNLRSVMRKVGFEQLGGYPVPATPSALAEIVVILGTNDMKDRHYYDCLNGTGFSDTGACVRDTRQSDSELARRWEEQMRSAFRGVVNVAQKFCGGNANLLLVQPAKLVLLNDNSVVRMTEYTLVQQDNRSETIRRVVREVVAESVDKAPGILVGTTYVPVLESKYDNQNWVDGSHYRDPLTCGRLSTNIASELSKMREQRYLAEDVMCSRQSPGDGISSAWGYSFTNNNSTIDETAQQILSCDAETILIAANITNSTNCTNSITGVVNQTCATLEIQTQTATIWAVAGYVAIPLGVVAVTLLVLQIWGDRLISPHVVAPCLIEEKHLKGKFDALEGIRWLAAMHIYAFHLNQQTDPCPSMYECRICMFGKYQVLLFFIVSGFISALTQYKRPRKDAEPPTCIETLNYVARRILPLLPVYFISLILAAIGTYVDAPAVEANVAMPHFDVEAILRSVTLTQTYWKPFYFDFNGPAWFLSNLVVFWVLSPHLMYTIARTNWCGLFILLLLCWAAMWGPYIAMYKILDMPLKNTYYSNYARNFIEFSPLTNAVPFTAGIVVARMVVCSPYVTWFERWQAVGISVIFLLVVILMFTVDPPGFDTGTHQLLASKGPALFPIFIALTVAASCNPCRDRLLGKFVASIGKLGFGDVAFSLYILHMPLHHVLSKIWGEDPGPYYNLWYEPLVQVIVAYVLAFTIERWWRKKVKEFFMKGKIENPAEEKNLGLANNKADSA